MAADNMKYIFGLRVSEFRRLNGLTQKELALKTGVTTSFITMRFCLHAAWAYPSVGYAITGNGRPAIRQTNCFSLRRCLKATEWLS